MDVVRGVAIPFDYDNVDTDVIMPKQFLKQIARTGLGKAVCFYWRYNVDCEEAVSEIPEFVLNREPYRGAPVMVAGENFGCGSSRENAPWGLADLGIQVIIAPSFADIFMNNCFKNGILCLTLPRDQVAALMEDAKACRPLSVDLPAQTVTRESGEAFAFEVTSARKANLLNGLEEIGLTLLKADTIAAFEEEYAAKFPFYNPGQPAPAGMDW